ncbi:class D beta-lactamase [Undibacterium griseum]|uniref:Beta-lactamase n=1 Tax=Undibacterium griseum TaxID=2762295 RepID=A0ABR6YIS3_9BURK|nr:class D beta-lactamase [Undibacterium griseum]MBC3883723.1 class D beta-lactamase [Undibacterium griseum]
MKSSLICWLVAGLTLCAVPVWAEDAAIAQLFAQEHAEGTLVLTALHGGQQYIHDEQRAQRRYTPASTFKILNTLIALEEKKTSRAEVLKWDGRQYDIPAWNRDQTLETAFQRSCVWCYQTYARRIGAARYPHYLEQANYGVLRTPFNETTFWLDGALQISALEQIAFLKRVVQRSLPFSPAAYETLRDIMVMERTPDYTMRAKSGWSGRADPHIGWYVGYVETTDEIWLFALNMELADPARLPVRQKLVRAALQQKGILP